MHRMRRHVEKLIVEAFLDEALTAGYSVTVFDCEEFTLKRSRDKASILAAMFTTDDDRLYLHKPGEAPAENEPSNRLLHYHGWVWFVYGNGGWDVISDYTCNLQHVMQAADAESAKWQ
jgi:hypothetical protein